jgi:hypothetical protein
MVNIVLGLNSVLSVALRGKNTVASSRLYEVLDRYNARVVGPSSSASDAIHYYTIENVDTNSSDGLVSELAEILGVEAVFVKPSDELP